MVKSFFINILYRTEIWIFLFCLAIIHGVSFHIADITDLDLVVDTSSYIGIFNFDFDQYVVRKYRIIVPMLARLVHLVFGGIFENLSPVSYPGDFAVGMSFLVVNNILMAIFGVLVYKLISQYCNWFFASVVGLLSVLTCRWTGGFAGLPLVDSLYLVVLAMVLLGLRTKSERMLIFTIFLGPWAKESFIFIAPIIFFYAPIPKKKQLIYFALSGILVFSFRFLIDSISGTSATGTMKEIFSHFGSVMISLKRLFSFHGLYEIFSITGFWILLIIPAIAKQQLRAITIKLEGFYIWYIVSVIIQAILSTDIARMLYMLSPVFGILWAMIIDSLNARFIKNNLETENVHKF